MIQNTYSGRDEWRLPGGGLTRRERKLDKASRHAGAILAANREVGQELGVQGLDLRHLVDFERYLRGANDNVRCFTAEVDPKTRLTPSKSEIANVGWFPLDDLPKAIDPSILIVRHALQSQIER